MKTLKLTLILSSLISLQAFAKDINLKCSATYNAQRVFEKDVTLLSNTRGIFFGQTSDFDLFLTSTSEDTVELQALNPFEPSRTFATAKLTEPGTFVELSIWKRDFLIEVRCTSI